MVIVSSGAIGVGLRRMDIGKRPKGLSKLQALAAIGQCRLMSLWDDLFGHLRQPIAQILLTRNDIQDRTRYINAQNTFNELMDMGVIPIVNENDTLAVAEIKFGDNDTLSAITAAMLHADYLFLMTDVDCLYDKNPRSNPDAKPIEVVEDISALQADVSTAGSALGTGGMATKIVAAKIATASGVTTVITRSSVPGHIADVVRYCQSLKAPSAPASVAGSDDGESPTPSTADSSMNDSAYFEKAPLHTRFLPAARPIRDRHFWLLHGLAPHGTIYIDQGAYKALVDKAGLLPVGVVDVEGSFQNCESVRLAVVERSESPGPDGKKWTGDPVEVGRCLVNYAATEVARIKGHQSADIKDLLGYADSEHVAHRNHVCFTQGNFSSVPTTPTASRPPSPTRQSSSIAV